MESHGDYQSLVTRATEYSRDEPQEDAAVPAKKSKVVPCKTFMKYKEHNDNKPWSIANKNCKNCLYFPFMTKFPNGKLPLGIDVLSVILTEGKNNPGKCIEWHEIAMDLVLHWVFCSVYTLSVKVVKAKLKSLRESYRALAKVSYTKRRDFYFVKFDSFRNNMYIIFDILADKDQCAVLGELWGVKMVEKDFKFYNNMCQFPQIGYCSSFVERKWKLADEKKKMKLECYRARKQKADDYKDSQVPVSTDAIVDLGSDDKKEVLDIDDTEFTQPASSSEESVKLKYQYITADEHPNDDMPFHYRNVRLGQLKVRPEIYLAIQKLKSTLHMSQAQAEGAIVETANTVFGRNKFGPWKVFEPNQPYDSNSLPASSNTNRLDPYVEAMVLSSIAEQMMSGDTSTIVYSNDGSAMSGVGKYVVQSVTIDGKQRSLPTMSIFTESRESLAELEKSTIEMLSAATAYKYSSKDLVEQISFVMTDSTAHNLQVFDSVCEELGAEHSPTSVTCNMHVLMMFQRKAEKVFQDIHDGLGNAKIKDCFLVNLDFQNQPFIIKALKCLSSFINRDFSAKPWNRSSHFENFIAPKKNESLSFKDHRFNRIFDCCAVILHHLDDIKHYLEKNQHVINAISIIDRGFLEMEILKPIFCATALMGMHITGPLMMILLDTSTTYSTMLHVFPKLYNDLSTLQPHHFLQTSECVVSFASPQVFKSSSLKPVVLNSLNACLQEYRIEVENILNLFLKAFSNGLAVQKGALFGFGPRASDDTGSLLKISTANDDLMQMLNKVPIHNLAEERSVGLVNYGIQIRGKSNLNTVSRNVVLHKSFDLLTEDALANTKKWRRPVENIKQIRAEWNNRMKQYEEKGYSAKEALNIHTEGRKLADIDFLKKQHPPGPFTRSEEVSDYLASTSCDDSIKNKRLYVEVRLAKRTCLSLKQTSSIFRLKKDGKNLDNDKYAKNLITYFDNSHSLTSITITDLQNVLSALNKETLSEENSSLDSQCFKSGDYVAAFWIDGNGNYEWFLANVVQTCNGDSGVLLSYFKKIGRNKEGEIWASPEVPELLETDTYQIISGSIDVSYVRSTRIKCCVSNETVSTLDKALKSKMPP